MPPRPGRWAASRPTHEDVGETISLTRLRQCWLETASPDARERYDGSWVPGCHPRAVPDRPLEAANSLLEPAVVGGTRRRAACSRSSGAGADRQRAQPGVMSCADQRGADPRFATRSTLPGQPGRAYRERSEPPHPWEYERRGGGPDPAQEMRSTRGSIGQLGPEAGRPMARRTEKRGGRQIACASS